MPGNYGSARTRIERSGKLLRTVACGAAPTNPLPAPPSSTWDFILETYVRTKEEVGSSPTCPPHLVRRTAALTSGYETLETANTMYRKAVRRCSSAMVTSGAEKLKAVAFVSKLQYEHAGDKKENRRDTEKQGSHHMTHQICDSPNCSFPVPPMSPRGIA